MEIGKTLWTVGATYSLGNVPQSTIKTLDIFP